MRTRERPRLRLGCTRRECPLARLPVLRLRQQREKASSLRAVAYGIAAQVLLFPEANGLGVTTGQARIQSISALTQHGIQVVHSLVRCLIRTIPSARPHLRA